MSFLAPNKRIALLWLASMVIWAVVFISTNIPLFPCQTFVYDSTQGFYSDICPLVIDGELLIAINGTYEDTRSTIWTWPVIFLILVVFPYLDSVFLDRAITAQQQRKKS